MTVESWPSTVLREHVELTTGFPFKSQNYSDDGGVRLLRGDNIAPGRLRWDGAKRWPHANVGAYQEYELAAGDVVLAMDRPWIDAGLKMAVVAEADVPALLVQRVARLRARSSLDQRFLRYLIASPNFEQHILAVQTGTAVPHISSSQIGAFRFALPPLAEQAAIGELLGALDEKVELNRRITATMHELAYAIFRSRYQSDNPSLPHEPLSEHVEVARGLSYTGAGLADEGIPLHNLNSIYEGGGYKRDGIKYYRGEYQQRHLVEPGDVVVATVEQGFDELLIAFPARIPRRFGKSGLFSQDLFRLRPRSTTPLSRPFIYLTLLRGHVHEEIAGYANGTTINRIPVEALQKPLVAVPPRELVEEMDALVTPLFDRAEAAEDESETLAQLRDTLLPKLISGEMRLRDVHAAVEAATA